MKNSLRLDPPRTHKQTQSQFDFQSHAQAQKRQLDRICNQKQKILDLVSKYKAAQNQMLIIKEQNELLIKDIDSWKAICCEMEQRMAAAEDQHARELQRLEGENKEVRAALQEALQVQETLLERTKKLQQSYSLAVRDHQLQINALATEVTFLRQNESQTKNEAVKGIQELTNLIQRQNKALSMQDSECKQLLQVNLQLQSANGELKEEVEKLRIENAQKQNYIQEINGNFQKLMARITKQSTDWQLLKQVEKIRMKISQQAKEQVCKIENIIKKF